LLSYDGQDFKTLTLNHDDTLLVVSDYSNKLVWINVEEKLNIKRIQNQVYKFNTGSMCFLT
jgi:hypothetical protein